MKYVLVLSVAILVGLVSSRLRNRSPAPVDGVPSPTGPPVAGPVRRPASPARVFPAPKQAFVPALLQIKSGDPIQLDRIASDLEYQMKIRRHVQLRAMMNSPAKDSEDFRTVDAVVQRYGFGIDLIPAAYGYAWQRQDLERRFPPQNSNPNPEHGFRMGMAESDFRLLLERNHGRTSEEFIRELQGLSLTTPFGLIGTVIAQGEVLYE